MNKSRLVELVHELDEQLSLPGKDQNHLLCQAKCFEILSIIDNVADPESESLEGSLDGVSVPTKLLMIGAFARLLIEL